MIYRIFDKFSIVYTSYFHLKLELISINVLNSYILMVESAFKLLGTKNIFAFNTYD